MFMHCLYTFGRCTSKKFFSTIVGSSIQIRYAKIVIYPLLRPLLFLLDPELVHEMALHALPLGVQLGLLGATPKSHANLKQEVWGIHFGNPLGLAAGFDKNAQLATIWPRFGFGFAELGTITARAQPGNPTPRLFRLIEQGALINRLGFNNDGAKAIAERLRRSKIDDPTFPLGINLGKSATTPLEDADQDYRTSYSLLAPYASYITINVSSPNTKGLRSLQAVTALATIIEAIDGEASKMDKVPPLLIKVSPDLDSDQLREIVVFALEREIDGLIATNTTISRDKLPKGAPHRKEKGGLSGTPLAQRSTEVVREVYRYSKGRLPIIGVGGIKNAAGAFEKIEAGASLVQMYTGFIYGGPTAPSDIVDDLARLVDEHGFDSITEAVGSAS